MTFKSSFTLLALLLLPLFVLAQGRTVSESMPVTRLAGISERSYSIYLPPSYDKAPERQYPVLYLMHGGGGSHSDWEQFNGLSLMANRLIASGIICEMIIVCPEGNQQHMMYFNSPTENSVSLGAPDWKFEDYFFDELIPYIESHYRVISDREHRAIGGFSMGGGAATVYGVHRPEKFCMVYDISGYQRAQPLEFLRFDPSAAWRQQIIDDNNAILRIANGTPAEVQAWRQVDWRVAVGDQDFTLDANLDLIRALRSHGIPCAIHIDNGSHDHIWVTPVLEDALQRASRHFSIR